MQFEIEKCSGSFSLIITLIPGDCWRELEKSLEHPQRVRKLKDHPCSFSFNEVHFEPI